MGELFRSTGTWDRNQDFGHAPRGGALNPSTNTSRGLGIRPGPRLRPLSRWPPRGVSSIRERVPRSSIPVGDSSPSVYDASTRRAPARRSPQGASRFNTELIRTNVAGRTGGVQLALIESKAALSPEVPPLTWALAVEWPAEASVSTSIAK